LFLYCEFVPFHDASGDPMFVIVASWGWYVTDQISSRRLCHRAQYFRQSAVSPSRGSTTSRTTRGWS